MSEEKKPIRRRPVAPPKHELSDTIPAQEPEATVPVHEDPIEQKPQESTATPIDLGAPPPFPDGHDPLDDKTDEEWAKEIERAKAEVEAGVPPVRFGQSAQEAEAAKKQEVDNVTNKMIDEEVRRRMIEMGIDPDTKKPITTSPATEEAPKNQKKELTPEEAEAIVKKQEEIAVKNDASTFVHLNLGTDDDLNDAAEREFEEDTRPQEERQNNPTDYAAGLAMTMQYGQRNNQQKLLTKWIGDILERNTSALVAAANEMRIARVTPKIGDGNGPKKLSGSTAKAAVISRLKGMYRVQLYNSGFWLDLRPPTLMDIDSWMKEVDTDFKELGRVLGGHAHSVLDIYLKRKFMEIVPSMVQRSNYINFNDPNRLVDNISYHDYDTLLWAVCCMMYKDGIGAGIYCTNPDCRHIDSHQFVDLRNICFLNTEVFGAKAQAWMTAGAHAGSKLLTDEDLKEYRDNVVGKPMTLSYENGKIVFELEVPTMRRYIEEGISLVTKIENVLDGDHDIHSDIVSNQITYHLYKMMAPWIKVLNIHDDKGNLSYKIEDREAIFESLDIEMFESNGFFKDITNYVRDTKASIYSATTIKCPKCGKVANLAHDNMFPMDLQYLFFCLSCLQLEQTGASF